MSRTISSIASEISENWERPYFGAVPYLQAMFDLQTVDDHYGFDSGRSIVLYFLANASSWRGDVARRVKAELKALASAPKGGR